MNKKQRKAQSLRRLADRMRDEPHNFDLPDGFELGEVEYMLRDAAELLEKED